MIVGYSPQTLTEVREAGEGGADETATPHTREERENYEAVVALAATRTLVRGACHADMRRVP